MDECFTRVSRVLPFARVPVCEIQHAFLRVGCIWIEGSV